MTTQPSTEDLIFAGIEQRGLQFLLTGTQLKSYKRWLQKSKHHKQVTREMASHQMPLTDSCVHINNQP